MDNIIQQDKQYIANTYNRFPLVLEKGNGALAYDVNGKEYVDMSSGIGVNSLGYSNEAWVKAISEQAAKLSHTSNLYYTLPQVELAQKLANRTGYKKVFFANSGAEANECAIKTARKYSFDKYGKDRNVIITLVNSFHGRTITTLAATGQEVFHNFFFPFTEGFKFVPANDINALNAAIDDKVAAIMFEFVQGEGGVNPLDKEFVAEMQKIAQAKDILLIADEVQTGIGRTGKMLASENFGIKPDLTTLAKGLGGGLPIGAVLFNEKTENVLGYSQHGTTFGGNPIVCAGAVKVLEALDDTLIEKANEKGEYIRKKLQNAPHIQSISGLGLMLGVKFDSLAAGEVVKACIEKGAIFLTAKEKLRMLPPLTITFEQIDKAIDVLISVLEEL